tara:strand:+ start:119 stop:3766 length:3648 start_codon:yes stop_codon:yes gene_type:complete
MKVTNFKKVNLILGWLCFLISFTVYYLTAEPTVSFWDTGEYITTSAKLQVGHPPGAPLYQMLGAIFSYVNLGFYIIIMGLLIVITSLIKKKELKQGLRIILGSIILFWFFKTPFEKEEIGFAMNLMSGFASALTIAFMYWSIVLLLKKITSKIKESLNKQFSISVAAFIGSLSFTFTDTFWFSAVEAEVYAMATLIMAVLFYLGLRWESDMDKPRGNKWLLLICFVIGLSFGVHFMGLLTIPAIVMIYYFKNQKKILQYLNIPPLIGFLSANIIGLGILMAIFKLLLPGTLKFFSAVELLFVNDFGLPFNSGTLAAFIFIGFAFYYSIYYTRKKGLVNTNTLAHCLLFIFIGFSSWLILPIRANADVVVNENDPSNARELLAYYNLEQYPKTYLFYGPLFTDQYSGLDKENPYKDDNPKYQKDSKKGKYVIVNDYKDAIQNYNSEHASILPRMWSSEHAKNYLNYTGYLDFEIKSKYRNESQLIQLVKTVKNEINNNEIDYENFHNFLKQYGQYLDVEKPSFGDNLKYLFNYQIGYMYWRYFMWNFSGRQDDIQGKMNMNGNWISGIDFIDEWHLGKDSYIGFKWKEFKFGNNIEFSLPYPAIFNGLSQKNLPDTVVNNKARNTYYMLPLLLGLIGLYFLFKTNKEYFWILLIFFVFTGIAIQVYTNVRPFEPRERDYSVVGSFYVFSMIIGLGVFYISTIPKKIRNWALAQKILDIKYIAAGSIFIWFLLCLYHAIFWWEWISSRVLWLIVLIAGAFLLATLFSKKIISKEIKNLSFILTFILCLTIGPVNLAINNWDDHDRSGRYTAYDMAVNYLKSCDENAILFTIGDNDTFPLWYAQEIEGIRTDIRVVNTSLLSTDWYINQMKRKAYDSDPIPSSLSSDKYRYGTRDYILKEETTTDTIDIDLMLDFVTRDDEEWKYGTLLKKSGYDVSGIRSQDYNANFLPTENIRIPVNIENVLKNNIVGEENRGKIEKEIFIKINSPAIYKNRLIMLDIIANNNWERPIYFSGGAFGDEDYIWMKEYLQLDGMCYKLVPIKTSIENPYELGMIDSDKMMSIVENWNWTSSKNKGVYYDVESRRNSITYRSNISRLVKQLVRENKFQDAEMLIEMCMEKLPIDEFGYYTILEPFIQSYYDLGKPEKARKLFDDIATKYQQNLYYFSKLNDTNKNRFIEEIYTDIERYKSLVDLIVINENEEFSEIKLKQFEAYIDLFM